MAIGDEPNIAGGLGGPGGGPGAFGVTPGGGSDVGQGHQALVKELGELHRGYRTIVEDLGKIKDELKAIGRIDLGTGGDKGSFNPTPKMPEGAKQLDSGLAVPRNAGIEHTEHVRAAQGAPRRQGQNGALASQQPRIPNPAGNPLNPNSPEVPETPSTMKRVGQAAAVVGGAAMLVGGASGSFFNREMPRAVAMDTARRNMVLGGTGMDQSSAMMRRMMDRYGSDDLQYAGAIMGMQSQGIIAGTQLSNRTVGASARFRQQVAPEMDMADIAGVFGGLNTGETAARLNRFGLRQSANDDPQVIMRRALQRLNQGRDLNARQLQAIRPGTTQFSYLSQVLGGEQQAGLAIRQELGRVTGQPVEGGLASDQVTRAEGSRGLLTMELQEEMDTAVRKHTGIVQTLNDTVASLDDSLQNLLTTTGALGSGLGGLVGNIQNLVFGALALRGGGGLIKGGMGALKSGAGWLGRGLSRGAGAVGGAISRGAGAVGGAVARGAGAVGGAVSRGAGGIGGGLAKGAAKIGGVLGLFTGGIDAARWVRDRAYDAMDVGQDFRDVIGQTGRPLDPRGIGIGDGIGDPGPEQTGGGSLLLQRTHHDASHVTGLHPDLRKRLEAMFAANPKLRLNSGYRSPAHQQRLWNEAVKKYGSESAARKWVAPPGKSNHNKGLAADIGPDSEYDWLKRNAPKFGLEPYAPEPWHWELKGTRSGQFENWSPEGGGMQGLATAQGKSTGGDGASAPTSMGSSLGGLSSSSASSILGALGGGVPADQGGVASQGTDASGAGGVLGAGGGATTTGAGSLSANQIAQAAAAAGFSGDALVKAVAIAFGESSGNPRAHNDTPPDNSYGLWQINMLGDMGPARRRAFGLSSNSELFDPRKNAQAAFAISGGGQNFGPWSVYTSGKYQNYLAQAQQAVATIGAGVGDRPTSVSASSTAPSPSMPAAGGGMRGAMGAPQHVTIKVMFQEATDEQAIRFAKKVSAVMKGEDRVERIGAN